MRRLSFLAFLALAGCGGPPAATGTSTTPADAASRPAASAPRFVDGRTGAPVAFDAMLARLAEARVVYVGERHDRPADHEAQRRIAEALHALDPSLAIGFEMFQHPRQDALDAYVAGELDEAGLLERTEWERRWGWDFGMYRDVVALGPRHRLPLVALNAPQELTRGVARNGLESLDEATRAMVPELDLEVASHRAAIMAAFAGHPGMDEAMKERFYVAQVIWDETMADRAAAFLARPDAPSRLVVLAGVMHVRRDAIPDRAARRGASPYAIVRPVAEEELDAAVADGVADFLLVTP